MLRNEAGSLHKVFFIKGCLAEDQNENALGILEVLLNSNSFSLKWQSTQISFHWLSLYYGNSQNPQPYRFNELAMIFH